MLRTKIGKIIKYSLLSGATVGTLASLHTNNYQLDSIGIVRFSRAAITVFKIGFIYKTELYAKNLDKTSEEYKQLKSACHKKGAENLLELCCANKGVYVKVGQHVAALEYLLPSEYVQTMKILHCHAPSNDISDVYKVIREDLKKDPTEIFTDIDPVPLGTASLAQVHKAKLKDGSVVAVKVQHPYVQGNSKVDLKTMEYLVKIMSWVFPEFKFQWLVDETKKNIPKELNFVEEGQNAEKIEKMFEDVPWLYIPKIRWEYTTSRVLVMDFIEGGQVNDLNYIKKHRMNPFEISDKLGRLYSKMIFINGFVHSDPHPGNIFLRKSPRGDCEIILLDHGLYATLTDEVRVEYANLWLSILNRDKDGMKAHCHKLGIKGDAYGIFACMVAGRSWNTIMKGVEKNKLDKDEQEFLQQEFPNILPQISGILDQVNRQMLLILKTNDLMRGIEYTLKTQSRMGAFKVMSNCCVHCVYEKQMLETKSALNKWKIFFIEYWTIFKINLYYTFINLSQYTHILKF